VENQDKNTGDHQGFLNQEETKRKK